MKKPRVVLGIVSVALMLSVAAPSASASEISHRAGKGLRSYEITMTESSQEKIVGTNGRVSSVVHPDVPAPVFFTPASPSYAGNSQYSHFTGQVNYKAMSFAWSDKLNAATIALAEGPMNETATLTSNGKAVSGYKDTHTGVVPYYLLHSSFSVGTNAYLLTINEEFPIADGTMHITTQFNFTVTLI